MKGDYQRVAQRGTLKLGYAILSPVGGKIAVKYDGETEVVWEEPTDVMISVEK